MSFWDFFWLLVIWLPLMLLWAFALVDVFRRDDMRGWLKALWVAVIILLPFFGTLIYLIFRPAGATPAEREAIDAGSREFVAKYAPDNTAEQLRSWPTCTIAASSPTPSSPRRRRACWARRARPPSLFHRTRYSFALLRTGFLRCRMARPADEGLIMRTHYPRTPHVPWSPGVSADDVRLGGLPGFEGREVVVTEKLDGENTTLYADGLHARSLDSAHHPSRTHVKALHGRVSGLIPQGWRVCGENVYARHSIAYDDLAAYFYAFSVWDDRDRCLDWASTVRFALCLGVPVPRVLWRGVYDEKAIRRLRLDLERQEGYVVRLADGFAAAEFGGSVAKWVRPRHVQTDRHWMHQAVIPNGLGPAAALWEVRSRGRADGAALLAALGIEPQPDEPGPEALAEVCGRLDLIGRTGDARLSGVLAVQLGEWRRTEVASALVPALGVRTARRTADLVGLRGKLYRDFPDGSRRAGLVRMSAAADLGVLHAVALSLLNGQSDVEGRRERAEWSALFAEDAGLAGEDPLRGLYDGLAAQLPTNDADVVARCAAEAFDAYADGRVNSPEEAAAATWRWRTGDFPRLVMTIGPSGSGKSRFAAAQGFDEVVSLDELRARHGSRADQSANAEVHREGMARLGAALTGRRAVAWDATCLNAQQRSTVERLAYERTALVTHAVMVTGEAELRRRNETREHRVPPDVLRTQLHRYEPPYPGQAHRTWYVADGAVADTAGGGAR